MCAYKNDTNARTAQRAAEFILMTKCLRGAPERLDVESDGSPHLTHLAHSV